MNKTEKKILKKQHIIYIGLIGAIILPIGLIMLFSQEKTAQKTQKASVNHFEVVTQDAPAKDMRLSQLESLSDAFQERMQVLEKNVLDLKEEKDLLEREKELLATETSSLKEKLQSIEQQAQEEPPVPLQGKDNFEEPQMAPELKVWQCEDPTESKNVLYEIPAGTVVKAVLVSGADCSVAVHKPTGPNMVLLRPLDNGSLPKRVRVPLKGSVIIGNAIGDISSERVYIRGERMTLVEPSGDFIETEVTAYVSGEDGREGMRGVVVDRSGQIVTRAAFAAFLQGVGQTVQATLNNQTIEKLARVSADKSILNLDMIRNSAFQGGSTALTKISDYLIKRAEQLQPAIQIAAGRIVDIVFTKTVKVGENNLKKKLEHERELKRRDHA